MRTTTYSTEKEIRVGIMIVVFTLAIFTTVKVKELQVNGTNNYEDMKTDRTEIYNNNFALVPVAEAKLIDEPVKESEAGISSKNLSKDSSKDQVLTTQMKSWINNGTYWTNDSESKEQILASQMKTWLTNGNFFADVNE